jgi:transposase
MDLGIFKPSMGGETAMVQRAEPESIVREIKRRTRKKYSSEEKILIVLEGLRGEMSIAELCRKEGLNANIYYKWSKEFLEAGRKRLQGDTVRSLLHAGHLWIL